MSAESQSAYYVHHGSSVTRIMVISSGIEGANYEQARGIIEEQVRAIARGEISRQEMENTRRGLINQLRTGEDNPFQKINLMLDQAIGGQGENTEEMVEKINEVTAGQVAEVAAGIQLDTVIYCRAGKGKFQLKPPEQVIQRNRLLGGRYISNLDPGWSYTLPKPGYIKVCHLFHLFGSIDNRYRWRGRIQELPDGWPISSNINCLKMRGNV